jgi:hypothetical protein
MPGGRVAAGLLFGLLLAAFVTAGATTAAGSASQATAKPSTSKVPLTFSGPHGYAGAEDYLKKVAAAYPGITELVEIGRSAGGRPIHVLVVSNMKTGVTMDAVVTLKHPRTPPTNNMTPMKPYQGKPAQWIDGGSRGTEPPGAEACLYIIDKLVSGYGSETEITRLVDENAFYICPVVNTDVYAAAADGKRPAQADANGNFPEGWWKDDSTPGGTGAFPSSAPEARAVLEFFTNHPNILLVQSFDTTGGYSLRPFARWPESRVNVRDLAVLDRVIGKKYLELIGETVPASWTAPLAERPAGAQGQAGQPAAQGRGGRGRGTVATPAATDVQAGTDPQAAAQRRPAEQPRAWRSPYTNAPAGYGVFFDWAYGQFGAFSVATQLSDPQRDASGIAADRLAALCETAWQFERYKASLLPKMEIREATAKVLYTTTQAARAVATQDGDTAVVRKSGSAGPYKVVQVTATIENTGALPTHVADGPQLRGNREDVVWLLGDNVTFLEGSRWMRLGVLQGTLPLPAAPRAPDTAAGGRGGGGGRGGAGAGATPLAQMREQRPEAPAVRQTGNRRIVSWLVAVEGNTPLKLALTSQKGGTTVKDLAVQ